MMNPSPASFINLKNTTNYTLRQSLNKPIQLAERAVQNGLSGLALTDIGNMAACVDHLAVAKEICRCGHHKKNHISDKDCLNKKCACASYENYPLKGILGLQLYIFDDKKSLQDYSKITFLSKNYQGWKNLIRLTSESNRKENYVRLGKPNLDWKQIPEIVKDQSLVVLTGSEGTEIANSLVSDVRKLYTIDNVRDISTGALVKNAKKKLEQYVDVFGSENVFLETQLVQTDLKYKQFLNDGMRYLAKRTDVACVATSDSYYSDPSDYNEHRIMLASGLEAKLNNLEKKLVEDPEPGLIRFQHSNKFYLPTSDEINQLYKDYEEEIKNSLLVGELCEPYKITNKPMLPEFPCPAGLTPEKYLERLCAKGWREKIEGKISSEKLQEYKDRIRYELNTIQPIGLSPYFLIVNDYVNAARSRKEMTGRARGSSAGSLISYLLGITQVDPILYDLMFERFYNAGRNTEDHISFPDIDVDFESAKRHLTFEYIQSKYGRSRTSPMITYGSIKGRGALDMVFRTKYNNITFDEVKRVTEAIPDESKINDQLQEMRELGEEPSIIFWSLQNHQDELKSICSIDKNGELQGEYSPIFRQAIKLEGCKVSQSKHPSGWTISAKPLEEVVPMIIDPKTSDLIPCLEMSQMEKLGLAKFDILALSTLDNISCALQLISGEIT